jgi:hypothetical protein
MGASITPPLGAPARSLRSFRRATRRRRAGDVFAVFGVEPVAEHGHAQLLHTGSVGSGRAPASGGVARGVSISVRAGVAAVASCGTRCSTRTPVVSAACAGTTDIGATRTGATGASAARAGAAGTGPTRARAACSRRGSAVDGSAVVVNAGGGDEAEAERDDRGSFGVAWDGMARRARGTRGARGKGDGAEGARALVLTDMALASRAGAISRHGRSRLTRPAPRGNVGSISGAAFFATARARVPRPQATGMGSVMIWYRAWSKGAPGAGRTSSVRSRRPARCISSAR